MRCPDCEGKKGWWHWNLDVREWRVCGQCHGQGTIEAPIVGDGCPHGGISRDCPICGPKVYRNHPPRRFR